MADATTADLRSRILQKLHVLRAGETAAAEDSDLVDKVITSTTEKLRDLSICFWDDGSIPQAIVEDFALYVACHLASDYMDAGEAQSFRERNEQAAEFAMRRIASNALRFQQPVRIEFF